MRGGIAILLLLLLLAFVLGAVLFSRGPSPEYRAAMESLRLETAGQMATLKVAFLGGLAVAVVIAALGGAVGLVRILWLRSQLIRPNAQGLYPVVQGRIAGQTYLHDPNRQLAGTVAYGAGPNGVEVRHLLPPGAEDAQLQVASQAQATQLVAAAAQGSIPAPTRRLVHGLVNRPPRPVPRMPEVRILNPDIPEERYLLAAIRHDWEGDDDDGDLTDHPATL